MTASPVDRFLDELFDRLAGTGPGGRRLLAEAEQHLADAVADARERGLNPEAAEREAVDRFGTATDVVRGLPATSGTLRLSVRRLAVGAWVLTGSGLAWYGLSGVVTWLLAGPWIRLLMAVDSSMCETSWVPTGEDCYTFRRGQLTVVPWGGADFPYLPVAASGVLLLSLLILAHRRTALGAPAWTPSRVTAGLALAVPFGIIGLLLLFYGTRGLLDGTLEYGLNYAVAALSAVAISVVAVRLSVHSPAIATVPLH